MTLAPGADAISVPVHYGQRQILDAVERYRRTVCMAGSGSGKTSAGAIALLREIQRNWDDDPRRQKYLVGAPTADLLTAAFSAVEPFLARLGDARYGDDRNGYVKSTREWHLRSGAVVRFRSLDNPKSIEGLQYRFAWVDELLQLETDDAFMTVRRRLGFYKGRLLVTSTPYAKKDGSTPEWVTTLVDQFLAGKDPELSIITFPSWANPEYDLLELASIREAEQPWRFAMMYEGKLSRTPQGAIFPLWNEARHVVDPFPVPAEWPRFLGYDQGFSVPTAILYCALDPQRDRLYVIDELYKTDQLLDDIAGWIKGLPVKPAMGFIDPAAASTNAELRARGVLLFPADNAVEPGIAEVWERLATDRLAVFRGRCPGLLAEIPLYRRENGKVVKANDHACDALRYLAVGVRDNYQRRKPKARWV